MSNMPYFIKRKAMTSGSRVPVTERRAAKETTGCSEMRRFQVEEKKSKKKMLSNPNHYILEAPHPSPYSAGLGFFGSRPFSQTNAFLESKGLAPIDWQIENI